jgi:phosphoribosyl 1,2-cyclic phosphodiesterase
MRLASLGSGSSGNATLLDTGEGLILIDCGLSARETERRMQYLDLSLADIQAILVTHEHADHIGGVSAVASKSGAQVFATQGTARKLRCDYQAIRAEQDFLIPGMSVNIMPVAVPHDAREPVQFTFKLAEIKVGVLTDLGSVTPHVVEEFAGCESLLVESNHCKEMLSLGPYPAALKRRILGPWGHLSNDQTAYFLEQIFSRSSVPSSLIIGHISKENNSKDRVEDCLGDLVSDVDSLVFASQDEVLPWTKSAQAA